jgi:peptide subunit release factor 1 (eRF1)
MGVIGAERKVMMELDPVENAERRTAIWIDHRTAILNTFVGEHLEVEQVLHSDAGPHTHGGGWSQQHIEAHNHELLKHFYDRVIDYLAPADEILILGPGQAKYELRKRIERHKGLKGTVVTLQNATKMSEAELIAITTPALGAGLNKERRDPVSEAHDLRGNERR